MVLIVTDEDLMVTSRDKKIDDLTILDFRIPIFIVEAMNHIEYRRTYLSDREDNVRTLKDRGHTNY